MSRPTPRVLIAGAGGMGALFGAILQDGGMAVTLYDTNTEHVNAIQANGLSIVGFGGERTVPISVTDNIAEVENIDLVLVQCKAHATGAVARAIKPLIVEGALAISFQNGLGNEETIAQEIGNENVLGGLTTMAGHLLKPGQIRDFSRSPSYIGELAGSITDRTIQIAAQLTRAGLETTPVGDVRSAIWRKLLGNIALSALSGATNMSSAELLTIPVLKQTSLRALDEALAVAASEGLTLDRDEVVHGLEQISTPGGTGDNKSSLCVDLLNGRPTEVDVIYGKVIEKARLAGVSTPTLETLFAIIKGIEQRACARMHRA